MTTDKQIQFTEGQKNAFEQFLLFLRANQEHKLWILTGYAGTGKSTLVAYIVALMQRERLNFKLLAPTGRAAKVLSNYAGFAASTIHRQIYFSADELGSQRLTLAKNLFKNSLFFIDEASMLNSSDSNETTNLLDDLIRYVYSGENCHLILIGDNGQLPPVGQKDSIALNSSLMQSYFSFLKIWQSELKEVVRVDAGSEILNVATHLRQLPHFKQPVLPQFSNDNNATVMKISGIDFQDQLEQSIRQVGADETILLTLSNKRANQWNLEIRNRLFFREEVFEKGDVLMVVKNNYFWLDKESKMGFIANGEIAIVERFRKLENVYGFDFALLDLKFVDYPEQGAMTCLVHIQSLYTDGPNLNLETLKKLYMTIENSLEDIKNKQKRRKEIYKNPYFNALQVKYAHAVTVHKAQGGQWAHVYIDYGFIAEDRKNKAYLRWLYTAITRASEKLFLLNFPEEFFNN